MEKLKKYVAFERATKSFGAWSSWTREQNVAYGLVRGVPYVAMERCANDVLSTWDVVKGLIQLGAWSEVSSDSDIWKIDPKARDVLVKEVASLCVWVRKTPRGPRIRPSRGVEALSATGE